MTDAEAFKLANKAYELFTMPERAICLTIFASLKYPSVADRFNEAVYRVVRAAQTTKSGIYARSPISDNVDGGDRE